MPVQLPRQTGQIGTLGAAARKGTYIVEFALFASLFFLFFFGILEYGRLIMVKQVMDHAARASARYAVVHTYDKTSSEVVTQALEHLSGVSNSLTGVSVKLYKADPTTGADIGDWKDAAFGECIAVDIEASYQPALPVLLLMPSYMPLRARCIMYSEAN
ncbi:MAG: hypothetical protein C4297_06790 [Gemmataceae bacterium]